MSATADAALAKLTKREQQALRTQLRRELRAELDAQRKASRRTRELETPAVAAAARRMIAAVGKRAATDIEGLAMLADLHMIVDLELARAVAAARRGDGLVGDHRYSWADVGRVLGISRQAAQMRFGKAAL